MVKLTLLLAILVAGPTGMRQYRLSRMRTGEGYADFARHFSGTEVPEVLLRASYDCFQRTAVVKPFPLRPWDDVLGVFGLANDDLDDLVREIVASSGYQIPADYNAWTSGLPPVRSAEDVVLYIHRAFGTVE